MTTITATLSAKIERRAKRAWRRHHDGNKKKIHRIKDVTDSELMYRLPDTPDYYGSEWVRVIQRADGSIEVDPKTTGLVDCQTKDDLKRLEKHGGEVRAYMLADANKTWGVLKGYCDKSDPLRSREECIELAKPGDRVYVVETEAEDLSLGTSELCAKNFDITGELDQERVLGFTTGVLDCRDKTDLNKLKKHIGVVRAYLLRKRPKKDPKLNTVHKLKDDDSQLLSKDLCVEKARPGDKAYVAELDYTDVTSVGGEKLSAVSCTLTEKLDEEKELGFTKGALLDLRTNADVVKLRKHVGPVRAYKYTDKEAKSPVQTATAILYEAGKDYAEKGAVTDERRDCAVGINVASVEWCKQYCKLSEGHRAFAFEFHSDDIAAIPDRKFGKLRVFKCRCVEEVGITNYTPLKPATTPPVLMVQVKPPVEAKVESPKKGFFRRLFGVTD
jgi:hypothetical protein